MTDGPQFSFNEVMGVDNRPRLHIEDGGHPREDDARRFVLSTYDIPEELDIDFNAYLAREDAVETALLRDLAEAYKNGSSVPPIVVHHKGHIDDGHHRAAAARSVGLNSIPAFRDVD